MKDSTNIVMNEPSKYIINDFLNEKNIKKNLDIVLFKKMLILLYNGKYYFKLRYENEFW